MFILLFAFTCLPAASSDDYIYNALHFGSSSNDYVGFNFDMAPFRNSLSLCSWIKRVDTSASYPVVFNYYISGPEIYIGSDGRVNMVVGDESLNSLESKFTTPLGRWFSYCLTWSLATRTSKLYLDGNLIATAQTPSGRALTMGGTLFFNRFSHSTNSGYIFGGQISQFNIYSDVLSSESIQKITEGGLCFDLEEFSEIRVLRWEVILDRSRNGNVREVTVCTQEKLSSQKSQRRLAEITGQYNETKTQLSKMERTLEVVTGKLKYTEEKLEVVTGQLNSTEEKLEVVTGQFKSAQDELVAVKGDLQTETSQHNVTEERLDACSRRLAETQSKLETARTLVNISRWDVLYTPPYFNKVLTEELFQQFTSSWDPLRKFVGTNLTDGVVEHFRQYHKEPECDTFEQFSSSMLRHFLGVEMTSGIIKHFKETHEDSACNNNTES
ncbi:uncharacterized protein LOC134815584 [Bolinopsis microptera]|uniref:uncharacterized protein LOC134815584 n=1 Tax=Bolinopsis microptera TaxID=2820187 RepID=UPI003078F362